MKISKITILIFNFIKIFEFVNLKTYIKNFNFVIMYATYLLELHSNTIDFLDIFDALSSTLVLDCTILYDRKIYFYVNFLISIIFSIKISLFFTIFFSVNQFTIL